jgi:hypothetical protein
MKKLPPPDTTPVPSYTLPLLTPNTPSSEVAQSDIDLTNMATAHLYQQWCNVKLSITELARLFRTTVEFTKHRRALMEMPYGVKENSKQKRYIVEPLD